MVTEWLRQVRVIDPLSETDQVADVWVVDGVIEAIAPPVDVPLPDKADHDIITINQPGLVLAPGLVDLYSHSGEPGYESRETLKSLAEGAIAGGFSRLTLLPDTHPVLDNPASIDQIRQHIQTFEQAPFVGVWGALTQETAGDRMAELGDLVVADVVGFADGVPLQNSILLRRVLEYGQAFGKPIALWPCDRHLAGGGSAREGTTSIQLGLIGNPAISETTALAALLEAIADRHYGVGHDGENTGEIDHPAPIHIMRVSTARSVELIQSAKARGLPITASTTWMHLLWTVDDLAKYDANLRLDPPLGRLKDQAALIQGVKDGAIDAIAIDHSPYTYEEKTVAFSDAPPGVIGLELALGILWNQFVVSGQWTALELWTALSLQPALCLNQAPPTLIVGQPAEMVLFDPEASWQITSHTLKSQSSNTPWLGESIQGKVLKTWTS